MFSNDYFPSQDIESYLVTVRHIRLPTSAVLGVESEGELEATRSGEKMVSSKTRESMPGRPASSRSQAVVM